MWCGVVVCEVLFCFVLFCFVLFLFCFVLFCFVSCSSACVGECTPYLTDRWLPLRELEKEMPISSSDDTQVVAQVRLGKLVRYRAKVTVRPDPCLVVLCSVCIFQSECCLITVGRVLQQVW